MPKLVRYRRPSLSTMLGVTKAKRRVKKDLGIYNATKVTHAPANYKRQARRKAGYESGLMKLLRFLKRKP